MAIRRGERSRVQQPAHPPCDERSDHLHERAQPGQGVAELKHRLHRAEPRAQPCAEGELATPPQMKTGIEVGVGKYELPADQITVDTLHVTGKGVVVRHSYDVHATARGKV